MFLPGRVHQTAVKELPPMAACDAIAKAWRPYRTVGSWFMWHVVETKEAAYTFL
jgi:3-methyladenine DNA glycosylase/8-oxoguanine DNA glycosylase